MEQSLESFSTWFRELYHLDKPDVREYSALTLAYIGDAVYEIIIRSYIVGKGNAPVERLHKRSSRLVKAETQANLIMAIEDQLTEEEHAVYKRGRNAKSYTMAKNATMSDYRKATGCEALSLHGILQKDGRSPPSHPQLRPYDKKLPHFQSDDRCLPNHTDQMRQQISLNKNIMRGKYGIYRIKNRRQKSGH